MYRQLEYAGSTPSAIRTMPRRLLHLQSALLASFATLALLAIFLAWTNVDIEPTRDDVALFRETFQQDRIDRSTFAREVETIRYIQAVVLGTIVHGGGDRHGESHLPREVFRLKLGMCYDRAFAMERFLRIAGFETRHVSVFDVSKHPAAAILYRRVPSHALTEVRTSRGWMAVGSNREWLGLARSLHVMSVPQIMERREQDFDYESVDLPDVLSSHARVIYGLYSRHGMFFPPYIPFPDVNIGELRHNLGR